MPVTHVNPEPDSLKLTITAEFAAPVERVFGVYSDPRQLERVWGPPGFPATVVDFDFTPGGLVTYYMTSPAGEKFGGWWKLLEIDRPDSFSFQDGFADADLEPVADDSLVSTCEYTFVAGGAGTVATYVSTYATAEALQQVLDMGVVEGASAAIGQIDDLLAEV